MTQSPPKSRPVPPKFPVLHLPALKTLFVLKKVHNPKPQKLYIDRILVNLTLIVTYFLLTCPCISFPALSTTELAAYTPFATHGIDNPLKTTESLPSVVTLTQLVGVVKQHEYLLFSQSRAGTTNSFRAAAWLRSL